MGLTPGIVSSIEAMVERARRRHPTVRRERKDADVVLLHFAGEALAQLSQGVLRHLVRDVARAFLVGGDR
jgi:hypothetical protein